MGDIRKSIVWADWSFNPVFGCLNKCPYCYAKKISYRLASQFSKIYKVHKDVFKAFTPVWLWSNFNKPIPDYVTHVFVNSMSDVAYWEQEWLSRVADLAIQEYPNKKFLFLTKCYRECCENFVFYNEPLNFYYGATVTCDADLEKFVGSFKFDFVSIEPIHQRINVKFLKEFKQVIVGAETGNRKGKIVPAAEWIEEIREFCQANNIKLFEKDSLKKIVKRSLVQQRI